MKPMKQKIALVIGGSGGIGSEAVKSLAASGYDVCISYYSDAERAKKVVANFPRGAVQAYELNLLDERSIKSTMRNIFAKRPLVDVVVFCPTLPVKHKPVQSIAWEDYERHFHLQVRGMFSIVQSFMKQIKAKHRTKFIALVTEYCIGKPPSGLSDYITAKYGLMGLMKTMAVELGKFGATFNMVSPGLTRTELLADIPPKFIEMAAEANPLKRIADPKDVAGVIAFLASGASDYLNGAHITVNGGSVML